MEDQEQLITLEGEDAVNLWLQGKKTWNAWVKHNPKANVSFAGYDFSQHITEEKQGISFDHFKFPNGYIDLSKVTFGDGDVSFLDATFGDWIVDFSGATFGEGEVCFSGATFGDGDVNFFMATFGDGYVDFTRATFGDGPVNFTLATFGNGRVDFTRASFGNGPVHFTRANFGKGDVFFSDATFGNGKVDFHGTTFGEGYVDFKGASLGEGNVDFSDATFEEGDVYFHGATFGKGYVDFKGASFEDGNVDFSGVNFGQGNVKFNVKSFGKGRLCFDQISSKSISFEPYNSENVITNPTKDLSVFSLRGATIDGPLILNYLEFNCVPDLRSTKLSHHVDLEGLQIADGRLRRSWHKLWFRFEPDQTTYPKLRRLKEIAEQFKNHQQALRFNAMEMRAARWVHTKSFFSNVLDMAYSGVSDYGQSIGRPVLYLVGVWGTFSVIYAALAWQKVCTAWDAAYMLGFSVLNTLPFIPIGREFRAGAIEQYFASAENWVYACISLESVLSATFMFLIGLGLRNKFRI